MLEEAAWFIKPIKGNRSKRLFGLSASLVRGEKIAQFGLLILCSGCGNGEADKEKIWRKKSSL